MSHSPTKQHPHPDELLPWFVNGTLSNEEQQVVESHIQSCPQCQQEISLLQSIRIQTKDVAIQSPGEIGLNRLLHDVQKERNESKTSTLTHNVGWKNGLAIAASFIIFIQAGLLIDAWFLSKPLVPLAGPQHHNAHLQISFVSSATATQIQQVLQTVQGTIVEGPSPLGIYRIRLEHTLSDNTQLEQTIQQLRQETTIIQHVAIN